MRPLRQILFAFGLLLLIAGGGALMFALRDAVQAMRHGGIGAAYNSPTVVVDGAMGLAFGVVGLALLRSPLQRRWPRLFVVVVAILVVLLGVHAGYVG